MKIRLYRSAKFALIDDDCAYAAKYNWCAGTRGYAQAWIDGKLISLHQLLTSTDGIAAYGWHIHHINGNKLDNRLINLMLVSCQRNHRSHRKVTPGATSRYRGVGWNKQMKRWKAYVYHEGKVCYVGLYKSETAAALARDRKALELGYDITALNFPNN